MAPLQDETMTFRGRLLMTVKCINKTNTIEFNSKNLQIITTSVSVFEEKSPETKLKIENFFESEKDETVGIKLDRQLELGNRYIVKISHFLGKINPPYSNGLFFIDISPPSTFIYITQFQMNFARLVFPCFDQPNLKAHFKLSLEHPEDLKPFSNMKIKSIEKVHSGWHMTQFDQTPKMSTYTLAFALIPENLLQNVTGKSEINGVNLTLHSNKFQILSSDSEKYFQFAKYSVDHYESIFSVPQPIDKLDFIIVPKFPIFGMENWGLIVLGEDFLIRNEDQEILSLIAHEIAHQWFGNLVTNFNWTFLCIQEGLAEHYTRRIVKMFFGEKNLNNIFEKYLIARYLTSVKHETENHQLAGAIQSFKNLAEAGNYCFGKTPFVFDMVENLLGKSMFDQRINKFLENFLFDNFHFDDLLKYFESVKIPAAMFMKFWIVSGGYPSVFVDDKGTVTQNQIVKEATWYRTVDEILWPLPITFISKTKETMNATWLYTKSLHLPGFPRNIGQWYVVNEEFQFFYRVNYDTYNWYLLSEQVIKNNSDLGTMTQVQLISDFCFFHNLGFLDKITNRISKINFSEGIKRLQIKTGLQLEFYFRDC